MDSIYSPKFNITDKIRAGIEAIDQEQWLIDRLLIMPKHEAWIHRSVSTIRVAATTAIEQLGIGEEAVDALAAKGISSSTDESEQANINALRAYEFVDYVSDQLDIPVDELVIRELNRVFLRESSDVLTPGSYRKGQNQVYTFTPPNSGDVPDLMRSFARWLREDDDSVHPIIRSGLAHIHFVAVHPFWDGNGRTARALTTLILQRSKYSLRKMLSLESEFSDSRDEYLTAIERTLGTEFRPDYDATRWLEFFIPTVLRAILVLRKRLTDWHKMMELNYADSEKFGISNRQADGVVYAMNKGKITRGDYIEITGVSPITATRDLAHLVKIGLFIAKGKTRNRFYVPLKSMQSSSEHEVPQEQARLPFDDESG